MIDTSACKFGRRLGDCRTLANESGWCPRHEAMIAHFGETLALAKEHGVPCGSCAMAVPLDEAQACKRCGNQSVCKGCLDDRACCISRADELDGEAESLEEQAEDLRDRAEDLRAGRPAR